MTQLAEKHSVTLLTGFLGAGKTTFLNALMAWKPDTRFAVIENEVGERGIDGDLIVGAEDNLMALNNGCICCSLNGNLIDILQTLHERRDEWDELLIEATGIADPAGVASPFFNHPAIRKYFELSQVIGLVDGMAIYDQLKADDVAGKQLAFSDTLLINKSDQISDEHRQDIATLLQERNPAARIYSGSAGKYPFENLLTTSEPFQWLNHSDTHDDGHEHHHHEHSIHSLTLHFEEPFDVHRLHNALKAFLMFQASGVYRVKGVVYDPNYQHKQWVQTVMDTVVIEEGAKWQTEENPSSEFVVIGKNLTKKGYERLFKKGLAR